MGKTVTYREMKRRRRKNKLHFLRKKYKEADSEEKKNKILEKVKKLAPWLSEEAFLGKEEGKEETAKK